MHCTLYVIFHAVSVLFCSRPRSEGWPHHGRTFSTLIMASVIPTDSSTGSPVQVLMLSIQAVRGRPRLRASCGYDYKLATPRRGQRTFRPLRPRADALFIVMRRSYGSLPIPIALFPFPLLPPLTSFPSLPFLHFPIPNPFLPLPPSPL